MYSLLDKYVNELLLDVLLPRMAAPCKDTRAASDVVAVRARTLRAVVAADDRDVTAVALRAATPRDGVVTPLADVVGAPRVAVVVAERDAVPRDVDVARDTPDVVDVAALVVVGATALRDATARDVLDVPRATVAADVRGLARDARDVDVPARAPWGAATVTVSTGAIGSANTARIETKVEQTKNAAASKKTVPTAFFK